MVGPAIDALGGISRVSKIYLDSGVFHRCGVRYIPSTTDCQVNRTLFLLRNLFRFIGVVRGRPETVYIHSSSNRSFFRKSLFFWTAVLFGKRIIFHIHPTHFYDYLTSLSGLRRKLASALLNRADALVVLTDFMKEKMGVLFPGKRIFVLRNPIDPEQFEQPPVGSRSKNQLLYLGWFIREKGVYDLVDAAGMLKEKGIGFKLFFFGTKQRDKLVRYVQMKNLNDCIVVGGWLKNGEKLEHLYRSTMLILPTYSEGIPNVILEAMATKTPILSTLVGGLAEVLKDNCNAVITTPGDPARLSMDIQKMLGDQKLREKISENAYQEVREKYDIRIIEKTFRKIIEETLK